MPLIHVPFLSSMLLSIALLIYFIFSGCNMAETRTDGSQKGDDHKLTVSSFLITIQKIPEWEPGLPRILEQVSLDNLGNGQMIDLKDRKITYLGSISNAATIFKNVDIDGFFRLNNRYVKSSIPGFIDEGNAAFYKFLFFDRNTGKMKIIDCEADKMPKMLRKLERLMNQLGSFATDVSVQGLYLVANPLGKQGSIEIQENTVVPDVSWDAHDRIKVLEHVLDRPTILFRVESSEYDAMRAYFEVENPEKKRGLFVNSGWGIVKLEFFRK